MMTFYAAAGSYQIRNEDGKDMPYIMSTTAISTHLDVAAPHAQVLDKI